MLNLNGCYLVQECATMFIDSREKEVKHAFALMFVEILLPVAAGANRELNVPALKGFVDMMYHHAFDLTKKTRHSQVSVTATCTCSTMN